MSYLAMTDPDSVPAYASLLRLDGKLFLVAGAGQGIGRQTAHALAALGATIVCVDREASLADAIAAEVGGIPVVADITQRSEVQRILDRAAEIGALFGIVDIVGASTVMDLVDGSDDYWEHEIDVNVTHMYLLTSMGGKVLAANGGGVITLIASVSGKFAAESHAVYGMAKAAVIALAKSAASEFGAAGVRVNTVSPGIVWTKRIADRIGARRAEFDALSPTGSVAFPRDIASAVLFLSSDLARDITGQDLIVDGGSTITSPLNARSLLRG